MGILKTDKPKVGQRVIYRSSGPDDGCRGTISEVIGYHYAVTWDDGETFNYTMNTSSCVFLEK
jgi:hypothetical protein